jgi:hypothetical protein
VFFALPGCIQPAFRVFPHTSQPTTYQKRGFYQIRAPRMRLCILPGKPAEHTLWNRET